jgi:citrate synthase
MASGLDSAIAAETVLSHADGDKGVIWVRGYTLERLVAEHGYEGAVAVLWDGFAGDGLTREAIRAALGAGRAAAFDRLGSWLGAASGRTLGEGVRLCLAALPEASAPAEIVGALAVGIAALLRAREGQGPVAPDPALATAADLLRMIAGAPVEARLAEALETYLAAVIDNGLSASTFTARCIASTEASLASSVTGAWCAFTGIRHGGAPGPVLDMLDELERAGDVEAWVEAKLARGERLVGFGHRVFRVRDPRAEILGEALRRLGPEAGRLAFAAEVERRVLAALERLKPGRRLRTNVELGAALLLEAVGLPRDAFTPVFALARCPGWIAHALEQKKTGRMIRPASAYVGPRPA